MNTIVYPSTRQIFNNTPQSSNMTVIDFSGVSTPLIIPLHLEDISGNIGSNGQVLSSTGTGIKWINNTSVSSQNLSDILANDPSGNAGGQSITNLLGLTLENNQTTLAGNTLQFGTTKYSINEINTPDSYSIVSNNILTLSGSEININGQSTFTTSPHVPEPVLGNDIASKGYVDSLVGQYSGGYNLFFNYTVGVSGTTYKSLGQTIVDSSQCEIVTSTNGLLQEVASFATEQLGITTIPVGIWNVLVYGKVNENSTQVVYSFKLYKYDGVSETEINIIGGESSTDIHDLNINAYSINATIATPYSLQLTDRIVIKIFVEQTTPTPSVNITTYFQNVYYSFTQSTLNSGTTLLTSTNTWSGNNTFSLGIISPSIDSSNGQPFYIGSTNATTTNIGRLGQSTNLQGNLQLAGESGTAGQVLTTSGTTAYWSTPTSTWIGSATTILNMNGNDIINVPSVDSSGVVLSLGTNAMGVTLGRLGQVTNLQGNLQLAGASGTAGQVLTTSGTTAYWSTLSSSGTSTWVGSATTILNMNGNDIMDVSSIDSSGVALSLGGSIDTTEVNIGRIGANTNIYGNLQGNLQLAGAYGTEDQVISIGTGVATWRSINELVVSGTNIGAGNNSIQSINDKYIAMVGHYSLSNPVIAYNSNGGVGITFNNINTNFESFLLYYNGKGYVEWGCRLSSTGNDFAYTVSSDKLNNILVAGTSNNTMTLFNSNASIGATLTNTTASNVSFLTKYNNSGFVQWVTNIVSFEIWSVTADINNDIIIGGRCSTQLRLNNPNGSTGVTLPVLASSGYNGFVAKYSDTGYAKWGTYITGNLDEFVNTVVVDSNNNIIVSGFYLSNSVLSVYNSNSTIGATLQGAAVSATDSFLVKYSDTGYVQWAKSLNGIDNKTQIYSTVIDSKNNIIVTGLYTVLASLLYNPDGTLVTTLNNPNTQNNGMIIKYSDTGYIKWATRVSGTSSDLINAVTVDNYDNIIIGVQSNSTIPINFDNSNGITGISLSGTIGVNDGILAKYSDTGYAQWAFRIAGTGNEAIKNIKVDSTNNDIIVGGEFFSTALTFYNANQSIGSTLLNPSGGLNTYVSKYTDTGYFKWASNTDGSTSQVFLNAIATINNTNNINNASFGNNGLQNLVNGINNTSLGYNAGNNLLEGSNNIYIGNTGSPFDNNIIRIGDTSYTCLIASNVTNLQSNTINLQGTAINLQGTATNLQGNLQLSGISGTTGQVVSMGTTGPSWRSINELVVSGTNYGAGNNAIQSINNQYIAMVAHYNLTNPVSVFNSDGSIGITLTNINSNIDSFLIYYNAKGYVEWGSRLSGANNDIAFTVSSDKLNNIIVAGGNSSTMTVYNSDASVGITFTNAATAPFLTKYNNAGFVQWGSSLVGIEIQQVTIDNNNDIIVGGRCTTQLKLNNANGSTGVTLPILASSGNNAFVAKYSDTGYAKWGSYITGNLDEFVTTVSVDRKNSVIIGGYYNSTSVLSVYNSDATVATTLQGIVNAATDSFLVKYSDTGYVQWAKSLNVTSNKHIINTSAVDSKNNIYVSGYYSNTATLLYNPDGTLAATLTSTNTQNNGMLIKYSDTGYVSWATKLHGLNQDAVNAMKVDNNDNIIVGIQTSTTSPFYLENVNGIVGVTLSATLGSDDGIIGKYSPTGYAQWGTRIAGTGSEIIKMIAIDSTNNDIIIGGVFTSSPLTLYNSNATVSSFTLSNPSGGSNGFVAKYSDTGYAKWASNTDAVSTTISLNSLATVNNLNNNNNASFGNNGLQNVVNGNNNASLGFNSGNALIEGSNNIYIGNTGSAFDNNIIRIGDTSYNCIITSNAINLQGSSVAINSINSYTSAGNTFTNYLWNNTPNTASIVFGSDSSGNTSPQYIGANNGLLLIGSATNRSSDIQIGEGSGRTSNILIGSNDINAVNHQISIGNSRSNMHICGSTMFARNINIASNASYLSNIINIGGSSSFVNISGLTISNNKHITLGTNTTTPIVGQLGYRFKSAITLTTSTADIVATNLYSESYTPGVYIIQYNGAISTPVTYLNISLSATTNTIDTTDVITATNQYFNLVTTKSFGTTTTMYLVAQSSSAVTISNVSRTFTRIA